MSAADKADLEQARAVVSTSEAIITGLKLEIALLRRNKYGWSAERTARLLTSDLERFMAEYQTILRAGLAPAPCISVDDTGARHARRDGITTQIGGSRFSVFRTGHSKSRLNFLSLLRAGCEDYIINDAALDYMRHRKVAPDVISKLAAHPETSFASQMAWYDHLVRLHLDVFDRTLVREITEAALWGAVRHHGLMGNTVVVSDDAGQFRIPNHALCWVHLWMPPLLQGYSVLRHVPRLRSSIRPVATMRPAPSASMVKSASRVPITRDELKARCTQRVRPAPVRPVMPSRSELPRICGGSLLTGSRP